MSNLNLESKIITIEESIYNFISKNRFFIGIFISLILLTSVAYTIYESKKIKNAKQDYLMYTEALNLIDSGSEEEGIKKLDQIIHMNRSGYKNLAIIYKIQKFKNTDVKKHINKIKRHPAIYNFLVNDLIISRGENFNKINIYFDILQEMDVLSNAVNSLCYDNKKVNCEEIRDSFLSGFFQMCNEVNKNE